MYIDFKTQNKVMPLRLIISCLCPFSLLKYFFNVPESIFVSIHLNLLSFIALWKWYCLHLLIISYKIYKDITWSVNHFSLYLYFLYQIEKLPKMFLKLHYLRRPIIYQIIFTFCLYQGNLIWKNNYHSFKNKQKYTRLQKTITE